MKPSKYLFTFSILIVLFFSYLMFGFDISSKQNLITPPENNYDSLFPYTVKDVRSHKNLQIYYLSGNNESNDYEYMTLTEAMEKNLVDVIETENVNELALTNKSEVHIFIQSGDIVKGGKQDRTIANDVIIPPFAQNIPISSFCVEAHRWSGRGEEDQKGFSVNSKMLSSRGLKIAVRKEKNQSSVWGKVAEYQEELNISVAPLISGTESLDSDISPSSLQLTLENEKLDSIRNIYHETLIQIPENKTEITGFAYAINGELYGAEIYNSSKLFTDIWPKLLDAIIVEAISELKNDTVTLIRQIDINSLGKAYLGKKELNKINNITHVESFEKDNIIAFDTYDKNTNKIIHRSFIVADTTKQRTSVGNQQRNNFGRNQLDIQQNEILELNIQQQVIEIDSTENE